MTEPACGEATPGQREPPAPHVARGELDASPDVALTHSLIMGPVFVWLYVFRRQDTDAFARDLVVRPEAALRDTPPRGQAH
ncbi:TetR/AcrR family transcriptional regulator C-terminal ligand-binding domain-containing protein [Nocardiopsis sp. EMB25]|uniref:hypothetical protein n=1 Tax=Nocardiopsis sp. EMB25 TaxID=2835867 RepID=UPI0022839156|nr:hypothetical protein [Nocardiopsis sp. EMB25]MCY9787040.1 TetR/AcrR family transcriptional regulator C-terminal ligand-binding domain-containing protein [Nocardiopsis sp. EMB25]